MSSENNLFYEDELDAQRLAADSFARNTARATTMSNTRYRIKAKRWGKSRWWRHGRFIDSGFVVTNASGMINVMPGAVWFETIPEAMRALRILLATDNAADFWTAYYATKEN